MIAVECHLAVEWGVAGMPICDYRAEEIVAAVFAAGVRRQGLARQVTVDAQVSAEMKPLPYQRLFLP
ncbi:hypothetical protein DFR68_12023 [Nocardia mexicana]|uniref:Uncharacterized protein n=1 Tax=Nocardia mexicana TaxID=279262 RepID=A0A370GK01_9NOCA|nr:hypothetical protein DFR68_12023 [Nocardia mexicana]